MIQQGAIAMAAVTSMNTSSGVSRRRVVAGAAWAVPAIAAASAVPAFATSLPKDPGINGWVLNSPSQLSSTCDWSLRVNSNPASQSPTPDGAPFGLYIYDTLPGDVTTNAKIIYWIIGTQTSTSGFGDAVWTRNGPNGSSCWGQPVKGTPAIKADGLLYTPYTSTYNHGGAGCALQSKADGRLWFPHFDYTVRFRKQDQSNARYCDDVTYWTQRQVDINGVTYTFERRNGTRGQFSTGLRRAAATPDTVTDLPS